ncbi:hypothetical protein RND71_002929 [Anisodus tanguticus]|uniref:Uncharacterized protein n=1 Tax=Anisodus tanguticus TaxID=243964 RepID=A0AAE1SSE3_9SOLA|nr:hypothetical protein RND71_002929 [Anisodus tanguticus]
MDKYITHNMMLADINKACSLMRDGDCLSMRVKIVFALLLVKDLESLINCNTCGNIGMLLEKNISGPLD